METMSKEDLIIAKAVNEAVTALKGLEKELNGAIKKFNDGTLNEAKAKALAKKVVAFMKKQSSVLKVQNSKVFGGLQPETQDDVVWLDGVVNQLHNLLGFLDKALSMAKKDPGKRGDMTVLVKSTKEFEARIGQPPKGVGTLLKVVKKGIDADHPQFAMVSLLPMILLMWMMIDTIVRGLKARR